MNCPSCKNAELRETTRTKIYEFGRTRVTAKVRGLACMGCDEFLLRPRAAQRAEHSVASALIANGVRSPAAFRFLRKVAGLKSVEAAQLLGVTPETVSRWEKGKMELSIATMAAIEALAADAISGDGNVRRRLSMLGQEPPEQLSA